MNNIKKYVGAMSMLVGATFYPQNSAAGTTTAEFLDWERAAQDSFFQISISMANAVTSIVRPDFATCIGRWYFQDDEIRIKRHAEILEVMPAHLEFSPNTIVIAYLEGVCGALE